MWVNGEVQLTGSNVKDDQALPVKQTSVKKRPYPPRLAATITTANNKYPLSLGNDGNTIFGRTGFDLLSSTDDWVTTTTLRTFIEEVVAVRELGNGELIVSTQNTPGVPGYLYVSSASRTVWTKVLTATNDQARFTNEWGLSVDGNVAVVSEYGIQGSANGVYLSTDYGQTFSEILDISTVSPDPARAHIHAAVFDPYWNRIWVTNGDASNNRVRYSDDWGSTWTVVDGSDEIQLVSIGVLPDCILFGSDGAPNGVYRIKRTTKLDMPVIELAYLIDNSKESITYMSMGMTQKPTQGSPMFISWVFQEDVYQPTGQGFVLATMDGIDFYEVWRDWLSYAPIKGMKWLLGPTTSGKLVGYLSDTRQVSGSLIKAVAPKWIPADNQEQTSQGSIDRGGVGAQIYQRTGTLAANTLQTVASFAPGKSVIIESLEFSSNNDINTRPIIELLDENSAITTLGIARNDGSANLATLSFANLRVPKSSIFEVLVDAAGTFKYALKPGVTIWMPNGGNIKVQNSDATNAYNVALMVRVRKIAL